MRSAVVAVILLAATAMASVLPAAGASASKAEPEVFGFLPYWLLDDALPALDLERVTTLAWFGVEANGAGELVKRKPSGAVPPGWAGFEDPRVVALQAQAQAAGVRFVMTIQRFGWTPGAARRTAALLGDPVARARLAQGIARLVDDRGLDGVNLDVEPVDPDLADELVALVTEVRAALDGVRPGAHLTVDVMSSLAGYDLPALTAPGAADAAILMGYDYRGAGVPTAGSLAPLVSRSGPDLRETLDAALVQVPADRLILALPWYGRDWPTESGDAGAATLGGGDPPATGVPPSVSVTYADAAERAEVYGRRYQPDQVSAWTATSGQACDTPCPLVWRQTWYDDPDSFGTKVDVAMDAGLRGVGIWALGHEAGRRELWDTLRYRLDDVVDETAPLGAAALLPEWAPRAEDGLPVVVETADLRLSAHDEAGGSGLGYVRVSAAADVDREGALALGRTYPATDAISFPLDDPQLGGSTESGPRTVHVQWRDLAGNWSEPLALEAWASVGPP